MASPYDGFGDAHFWARQVGDRAPAAIDYDPAPKLRFDLDRDVFATAGSCFAQHIARHIVRRGGRYLIAEQAHPLAAAGDNGYGTFSARYGNIYSIRQLRELLEQACGLRPPVLEFAGTAGGRWVDMLRPRAVPQGFSSPEEARNDRLHHLDRVRRMLADASVLVFTLGLTETWENVPGGYVYPLCPGAAAGTFDPSRHRFDNRDFDANRRDLRAVCDLIAERAPGLKLLLTVSPVMLVATAEDRGAVQSSMLSKSVLRAVADAAARAYDFVDYFPSYEIVAGPQARGRFFAGNARDVNPAGVECVMDAFFAARVDGTPASGATPADPVAPLGVDVADDAAFEVECDEILLGPGRDR